MTTRIDHIRTYHDTRAPFGQAWPQERTEDVNPADYPHLEVDGEDRDVPNGRKRESECLVRVNVERREAALNRKHAAEAYREERAMAARYGL